MAVTVTWLFKSSSSCSMTPEPCKYREDLIRLLSNYGGIAVKPQVSKRTNQTLRTGGNKRGSANSVKRMYFDLSQLSAPWSPPGGHEVARSDQATILESSTVCVSTRF